ncbi:flagellar assembly protein FliW [Helicobacter ailurogastricus]|uniref:Flagellar assembly factor FliW n=1 Tax=Helicobacter ailurogastricus TaxID=1578720 RepID=A0A0K2X9G8_9HELI|nr:flagellar assembly protein FliW [Helicobacter ailurogastricus]CRF40479.1 Flagellar assembly factor FliW [Helicobacter ailurogastricus]CRF43452.1 Flagellar assembly factor FliW [Helicobacter ailurogastricus]CRF44005.1 Flagellar assembly factor FliW [Helicobacter ailurogastricus]CRF52505.1 Flagellar assembly factor FliW [Helicobacter ailurogastricus]BDQ29643.1 flagellar assembly factor FliW 1 [Helicobacter ailurogastricus]
MRYTLKAPILGFEKIMEVELTKIDDLFSRVSSVDGTISMVLANPYKLREYSFSIPKYIELLLELNAKSHVEVYCVVVVQKNLEDSMVNFLAPLVFNPDNGYAAQIALSIMDYPDFGFRDTLKSFVQAKSARLNS